RRRGKMKGLRAELGLVDGKSVEVQGWQRGGSGFAGSSGEGEQCVGLKPDVQERIDEADVDVEHEHDRLLELSTKGRTRTSTARSRRDMAATTTSETNMIDVLPVASRRWRAR